MCPSNTFTAVLNTHWLCTLITKPLLGGGLCVWFSIICADVFILAGGDYPLLFNYPKSNLDNLAFLLTAPFNFKEQLIPVLTLTFRLMDLSYFIHSCTLSAWVKVCHPFSWISLNFWLWMLIQESQNLVGRLSVFSCKTDHSFRIE